MEILHTKNTNKENHTTEVIGIHANSIVQKNIAKPREVNMRMDALCMDQEIAKNIFGEEIYNRVKDTLKVTKPTLNTKESKNIETLPEFQEFLKAYTLEKNRLQAYTQQEKNLHDKKDILENMDMPEELIKIKNSIQITKAVIRETIDEKQEKIEGNRKTYTDILKKSGRDEAKKREKANQIYDFIIEYMETPHNKKKQKTGEKSSDFYKRIGMDYPIGEVRKGLVEQEKKLNEKIKKRKEKAQQKIKIPKQTKEQIVDYTKEARQIFEKEIKEYRSITERFYLPEDLEQIKNIQDFFKKKLKETIPSLNIQQLTKDHTIPIHSIEKVEDKIKLHPSDYVEIERRKIEYTHRFVDGDRDPKEYLFDRLVEYIGKDILTHKIQNLINESKQYKGTTFFIEKTDPLDDTSAGADFMVTYTIPGKQRRKIAAVDLFISNKTGGKEESDNEDGRKHKNENAKIERIPYSTYIHLFDKQKEKKYDMQPLQRYVEQQDPLLIYTILTKVMRNQQINIDMLLQSFDTKGTLYTTIQESTNSKGKTTKNIEEELHKNILAELEKVAA